MGIEYHHVHHINPSIPGYKLHLYHQNKTMNVHLVRLSLRDVWNNLWLVLYDEHRNRYVSFSQVTP